MYLPKARRGLSNRSAGRGAARLFLRARGEAAEDADVLEEVDELRVLPPSGVSTCGGRGSRKVRGTHGDLVTMKRAPVSEIAREK